MKNKNLLAVFFVLAGILIPSASVRAQKLKYVTFFPVPFGNHSDIFVKNKAVLGAGDKAEIIFAEDINLALNEAGDTLPLKGLSLSVPNTQNAQIFSKEDVIVAALNSSWEFQTAAKSFFKAAEAENSSKGILNFGSSAFSFRSGTGVDSTINADKLIISNLQILNKNGTQAGYINASGCRNLCWTPLKLPKESDFKLYLICSEQDSCPVTGYESQAAPYYWNFYMMSVAGQGWRLEGIYKGAASTIYQSVSPSYYESNSANLSYYYSAEDGSALPTTTATLSSINFPYNMLGTYSLDTVPISVPLAPASATYYGTTMPPTCPEGISAETICLTSNSVGYKCLRNKDSDFNIQTLINESIIQKDALVDLLARRKMPYVPPYPEPENQVQVLANSTAQAAYLSDSGASTHFCCPDTSQDECFSSQNLGTTNNAACYGGSCTCDLKVGEYSYQASYFELRLYYYQPQWKKIATMIECR